MCVDVATQPIMNCLLLILQYLVSSLMFSGEAKQYAEQRTIRNFGPLTTTISLTLTISLV